MLNEPCLSELPDFIPAGVFGTPNYGKAAGNALAKNAAVEEFVNFLARLTTPHQHTSVAAPGREKAAGSHA